MCIGLHVKCRYSCQILMKLEISRRIFKNIPMQNFIKILPVVYQLFHADGRPVRRIARPNEINNCFSQLL